MAENRFSQFCLNLLCHDKLHHLCAWILDVPNMVELWMPDEYFTFALFTLFQL
jgi:hypothetical protein